MPGTMARGRFAGSSLRAALASRALIEERSEDLFVFFVICARRFSSFIPVAEACIVACVVA